MPGSECFRFFAASDRTMPMATQGSSGRLRPTARRNSDSRPALRGLGIEGQPERAPLGIPTDRPPRPGMDNAPAQRLDLAERRVHVSDREVGQRDRVAGTGAALVDAYRGVPGVCLPAAAFGLAAVGQLDAEEIRPEPSRAAWIVGGGLD